MVQLSLEWPWGAKGHRIGWEQRWLWNVTLGNHSVWAVTFFPASHTETHETLDAPKTPVAMLRAESCLRSAFLYDSVCFEDSGRPLNLEDKTSSPSCFHSLLNFTVRN